MRRLSLIYSCIAIPLVIGFLLFWFVNDTGARRDAVHEAVSMNHLKQIGLAMSWYAARSGHFPARAIFSKEGKALLSWRVELLPYMDQKELFQQFHLDEPWDSPHNQSLIDKMPRDLVFPGDEAADGKTHYVVPVGKGTAFDGEKGFGMSDIRDGLGNTIFALEDDNSVIWTKPDDLDVDLESPMNHLGNLRPQGFNVLLGDGAVLSLPKAINPATLKALFTRAGGEIVDPRTIR